MNGRVVVAKPLYVALAQRKEDRKAHLAAQYMQRMAGMRMQVRFPQPTALSATLTVIWGQSEFSYMVVRNCRHFIRYIYYNIQV